MADLDWVRFVINAVIGAFLFEWGRWSQRRTYRRSPSERMRVHGAAAVAAAARSMREAEERRNRGA